MVMSPVLTVIYTSLRSKLDAVHLQEEKRNLTVKYKGSTLLLQIMGLANPRLSVENIITMHLRVLTGRFTSFSYLPLFYCHYINYYLSLRCQVFLSLLASFLKDIMNSYLLFM